MTRISHDDTLCGLTVMLTTPEVWPWMMFPVTEATLGSEARTEARVRSVTSRKVFREMR